MAQLTGDFVIVGGGLAGSALAARLKQRRPSSHVLLIEAGPDLTQDSRTKTFGAGLSLLGTSVDWAFTTTPQANTSNRTHTVDAGKALGGGSLINYGGWGRACSNDYDLWAAVVGDNSWNFVSMLPYFRKSETYYDSKADPKIHGFRGPITVTSPTACEPQRKYPLRDPLFSAWSEAGAKLNTDPGDGTLVGISESLESWYKGQRQSANRAYNLKDVQVLTNTLAHRIMFSRPSGECVPRATGVLLANGKRIEARSEVIICAGALKTPQLLILSGIGPASLLNRHGIEVVYDSPEVGANLIDHYAHFQVWKLHDPEKGSTMGSKQFPDPHLAQGIPLDWAVNENVPATILSKAIQQDEEESKIPSKEVYDSLLDPNQCHTEALVMYTTLGLPGIPQDGSYLTTSMMILAPTSRGTVSISSAEPTDNPVIDPNYYDTAIDRAVMIHGTRRVLQALLGTATGKEYFECEAAPPGMTALTPASSDAEIDARIRATGAPHHHSAGTAAMGKVVDTRFSIYGVKGLRIVDNSISPVPIGAHPQATLYAIAEKAADIILEDAIRPGT